MRFSKELWEKIIHNKKAAGLRDFEAYRVIDLWQELSPEKDYPPETEISSNQLRQVVRAIVESPETPEQDKEWFWNNFNFGRTYEPGRETKVVSIRLPVWLVDAIEAEASASGKNKNQLLSEVLTEHFAPSGVCK